MDGTHDDSHLVRRPLCLVTGGAAGFGFELARTFAAAGCDLVLAGDGQVELELAAEELAASVPDVNISWLSADLTRSTGPVALHHKLRTLEQPIEILVANAAVGAWGDFGRPSSLEDELATAQVNTLSTLHLARLVARDMARRGSGQILFAASRASAACVFDTVQTATRAFASALAEGLATELAGRGVLVTSLCPEIEPEGASARLQDPDAVIDLAREATTRALSASWTDVELPEAESQARKTHQLFGEDARLQAALRQFAILSAEIPMA